MSQPLDVRSIARRAAERLASGKLPERAPRGSTFDAASAPSAPGRDARPPLVTAT